LSATRGAKALRVAAMGVALLAGCGDPGDPNARFSEIERDVFLLHGGCTACHPDGTTPLNLQEGRAHSALVRKRVTSPLWEGTPWAGWMLVDPGHPERSALMIVLERPEGLPMGLRMPPDSTVPDEELERVRAWIAAGARND